MKFLNFHGYLANEDPSGPSERICFLKIDKIGEIVLFFNRINWKVTNHTDLKSILLYQKFAILIKHTIRRPPSKTLSQIPRITAICLGFLVHACLCNSLKLIHFIINFDLYGNRALKEKFSTDFL